MSEIYFKLEMLKCQEKNGFSSWDSDTVFCIVAVTNEKNKNTTTTQLQ